MRIEDSIVKNVYAALAREPRVNEKRSPISVRCLEDHTFWLLGEVESIEEKRAAVECAKAVDGVRQVVDRLSVRPATKPGDGATRDSVCRQLLAERAFMRCAIARVENDEERTFLRNSGPEDGHIDVSVADGVVTLRGQVISLSHRRLAAVLAWWSPGCRDVINALDVTPSEEDNDGELNDAVQLVLEKDPLVHADRITTQVKDRKVVLRGVVASEREKQMAAQDAWYVEGARDVINEIRVY